LSTDLGTKECHFKVREKNGYPFAPSLDVLFDGNRTPYNLKWRERVLLHELARLKNDIGPER